MSKYENILLDAPQAGTSGVTLSDAASKEPALSQKDTLLAGVLESGNVVCPESFKKKLKDLLEYQRTGDAKKTALAEELRAEKAAGKIDGKFFFEYPDTFGKTTRQYILDKKKPGGFSIYRFGNTKEENYFSPEQGYKGIGSHWSETGRDSELNLVIWDKGKLVNKEYPEGKNETLYMDGHKSNRWISWKFLCQLLSDKLYLPLYCDREYLKNHQNEKYTIEYIMDTELRYAPLPEKAQSVEEMIMSLYLGMPELTEAFFALKKGGNKYKKFRDVFVNEIKEVNGDKDGKDTIKFESDHKLYSHMRYMKRGIVVWHAKKIIAILIPKRSANINVVCGPHVERRINDKYVYLRKVDGLGIEPGPNWEYYVATTIDYIATNLTQYLSVGMDVAEQKPEGLPDDLWSLWIRMRYENFVKKDKK